MPERGVWNFKLEKVWEKDGFRDDLFKRPAELRVSEDETLIVHDFDRAVSYIYSSEGESLASFAEQGAEQGQVSRYLNCFLCGDKVVVGSPRSLHFYTARGKFIRSVPNNLMVRFPLFFFDENSFLYGKRTGKDVPPGKARLVRADLSSGEETLFYEFDLKGSAEGTNRGPNVIVLGLTPQFQLGSDFNRRKFYIAYSDRYFIHAVDFEGNRLSGFGVERAGKKVSLEDKREHFQGTRIPKDHIEQIIPILPDVMTSFQNIAVNGDFVYVFTTQNLKRRLNGLVLDVFTPAGKFVYQASIDFGLLGAASHPQNVALKNDSLYAVLDYKDGRKTLAKFKISLPR
jgi:hypothetical protein